MSTNLFASDRRLKNREYLFSQKKIESGKYFLTVTSDLFNFYLDNDEIPQVSDVPVVGQSKEHGEGAGQDHADAQEDPQVQPLRDEATDVHSGSIGEEVGVVQRPLQLFGFLETLIIQLI